MFHETARWWLLVIVILAVAVRLALILALPYDAGPDERRRYDVVRQIYTTGRAPRFGLDGGPHYVVRSVFGYRIAAGVAHLVPGDLPLFQKLRVSSALLGAATVIAAYAMVRQFFPRQPGLAAALAAVLAFHPQFLFLGAYVNADAYTILANVVLLLVLAYTNRQERLTFRSGVALGVALGLVFLGREYGWVGFVLAGAYLAGRLRQQFRATMRPAAFAGLIFLVFPLVFYLHQYSRYGTAYLPLLPKSGISWVPPGMTVAEAYQRYPLDDLDYPVFHLQWQSPADWWILLHPLFLSSFGLFGYMDVGLPERWYVWYLLVLAGGVFGGVRYLRHRAADQPTAGPRALLASMVLAMVASVLVVVRHNFVVLYQPQGRYLFPVLVPALLLVLLGWDHVSPDRGINRTALGAVTAWFVLAGVSSAGLLIRLYA